MTDISEIFAGIGTIDVFADLAERKAAAERRAEDAESEAAGLKAQLLESTAAQERLTAERTDLAARLERAEFAANGLASQLSDASAWHQKVVSQRAELEERAQRAAASLAANIAATSAWRERLIAERADTEERAARMAAEYTAQLAQSFGAHQALIAERAELAARVERAEAEAHALLQLQTAQAHRDAAFRERAGRIIGAELASGQSALDVLDTLHLRLRQLERDLDQESAERERLSERSAERLAPRRAGIGALYRLLWPTTTPLRGTFGSPARARDGGR